MHNKNWQHVNLFSDVAASLPRAKLALYVEISVMYKSPRCFYAKTALLPVAHPSDILSGNAAVICCAGKRDNIKKSSAIKELRFVLRFYVVN